MLSIKSTLFGCSVVSSSNPTTQAQKNLVAAWTQPDRSFGVSLRVDPSWDVFSGKGIASLSPKGVPSGADWYMGKVASVLTSVGGSGRYDRFSSMPSSESSSSNSRAKPRNTAVNSSIVPLNWTFIFIFLCVNTLVVCFCVRDFGWDHP